jgi:hypothetical protein
MTHGAELTPITPSYAPETFLGDFATEVRDGEIAQDTVLIQSLVNNDGIDDTYDAGRLYSVEIQYEVQNIITAEGEAAVSTAQIYLDGGVVVTARDKITFNGVSPKILRIGFDPGGYGVVLYS